MTSKICAVLALLVFAMSAAQAGEGARTLGDGSAIEVYPAPFGVAPSAQYSVELIQDEVPAAKVRTRGSSFVYQSQNPAFLPNGVLSGIKTSSTRE